MGTKRADERAAEVSYAVPGWYWDRSRATAIENARKYARRRGADVDADPEVHVVLVWPQKTAEAAESVA